MTDGAPTLGVGMVGYAFMGAVHSQAWRTAGRFFDLPFAPAMTALCGRDADAATALRRRGWAGPRWRPTGSSLLDAGRRPARRHLHSGRHPRRDRHRGARGRQARAVREAAGQHGGRGRGDGRGRRGAPRRAACARWSAFNYRRVPAIALARKLVADGRLGTIRHVRAQYLQDWIVDPSFPLVWRLQKDKAGSGALGDIGAHIIDLAQYVVGSPITGVTGLTETFVRERPLPRQTSRPGRIRRHRHRARSPSTTPRCSWRGSTSGALGSFEATRFATGRKNAMRLEINGSRRQPRLRLRGDERAAVPRPHRGRRDRRVPAHPRHRADAPVRRRAGGRPGTGSATSTRSPTRSSTWSTAIGDGPGAGPVVRRRAAGAARARRRRAVGRRTAAAGRTSAATRSGPGCRARRHEAARPGRAVAADTSPPRLVGAPPRMGRPHRLPSMRNADAAAQRVGASGDDPTDHPVHRPVGRPALRGDVPARLRLGLRRAGDRLLGRPPRRRGRCRGRRRTSGTSWTCWPSTTSRSSRSPTTSTGQAVCDDPIDERHRGILSDRVWGDGDPEGVRQRAAEEMKTTARAARRLGVDTVVGFTGSKIWKTVAMFPPVPAVDDRRRLPGLRRPLEPDPRRVRRGGRPVRARGAPERDRLRLLDDACAPWRRSGTGRRSG